MFEIKYEVKIPMLTPMFDRVRNIVARGLYDAAIKTFDKWVGLAGQTLTTSYEIYIKGLRQDMSIGPIEHGHQSVSVSVSLVDPLAKKFETGFPPYDMKPYFLRRARQEGKEVKKVWLPMRAPGKGTGVALHVRTTILFCVYGWLIGKLPTLPSPQITQALLPPGVKPEDIIRNRGRQYYSTYGVIRSVSPRSKPDSWIHPGYRGARLIPRLMPEVGRIAKESLDNAFKQAGMI